MSSPSAPPLDSELAERVLVRFLRDEASRAGFSKLVVGVSGGLDSAVASLLAARAVGPQNVCALAGEQFFCAVAVHNRDHSALTPPAARRPRPRRTG